jgi:hypothetical protein
MMRIKTGSPHCHSCLVALQDGSTGWQGLVCAEGLHSLLFGVAATTCVSDYFLQVMTAPGIMKMKAPAWDCDA